MDSSIYLNNGKYGQYLNHNKRLCSVPQCFQKPIFNLKGAIKIIKYKASRRTAVHIFPKLKEPYTSKMIMMKLNHLLKYEIFKKDLYLYLYLYLYIYISIYEEFSQNIVKM